MMRASTSSINYGYALRAGGLGQDRDGAAGLAGTGPGSADRDREPPSEPSSPISGPPFSPSPSFSPMRGGGNGGGGGSAARRLLSPSNSLRMRQSNCGLSPLGLRPSTSGRSIPPGHAREQRPHPVHSTSPNRTG